MLNIYIYTHPFHQNHFHTHTGEDETTAILQNGAVLGLPQALLPGAAPTPHAYTAASFVHFLYFDKAAILAEAAHDPPLLRSLYWGLAAEVCMWVCGCTQNQARAGSIHRPNQPPQPPIPPNQELHRPSNPLRLQGATPQQLADLLADAPVLLVPPPAEAPLFHAPPTQEAAREVVFDGAAHLLLLAGRAEPVAADADAGGGACTFCVRVPM